MHIYYAPTCAGYAAPGHPDAPFRVLRTDELMRERHPGWLPEQPVETLLASDEAILRAHSPAYLRRLVETPAGGMFDADTAVLPGMAGHARRGAGAAMSVAERAWGSGDQAFSLMRPPGHHATRDAIMGFCYLNSAAIAALHAQAALGVARVAVWDFDAHHGNGTEDILRGKEGMFYASVHQYPGYPGTGTESFDNVWNGPVSPGTPPEKHLAVLEESWAAVLAFKPDLILVSAGFDAYAGDPLTDMTLRQEDFATLGEWCRQAPWPVAAILEGGYSQELPALINTFLEAWEGKG